jgi:hypothetical protein
MQGGAAGDGRCGAGEVQVVEFADDIGELVARNPELPVVMPRRR